MRGRSCPPHYRLLRAAPCSWKPLYSPLSYSKSPIRLRSAPFSPSRFLAFCPLPSPRSRRVSTIFESGIRGKNSWTTLDRKQQFLLRWMSEPARLDTFRRITSLEKKGLRGVWISPSLLEIFARDEKIIDPKDYDVDLRENFPRISGRMKRKFLGARMRGIR